MKQIIPFLLAAILIGCKQKQEQTQKDYNYNTESALIALSMARSLMDEETPTEEQWSILFSTRGYQNYFCSIPEERGKPMLKEAFTITFHPDYKAQLDSLMAMEVSMDENGQKLLIIKNFADAKQNIDQIEAFIKSTDFSGMMRRADSLVKNYLPEKLTQQEVDLFDVEFVMMDPDAWVNDCGLVMDIRLANSMGEEDLTKMIAHEYHHNYRNLMAVAYQHPLMLEIDRIHREGVADLVDKEPPTSNSSGLIFGPLVHFYKSEYDNTPEKLRYLDSLTVAFSVEELSMKEYSQMVGGYFTFGGHPNGYYMANMIKAQQGTDSLIATSTLPFEFLKLYNQAASRKEGEHIFSDSFMEFANSLIIDPNQQKTYSEEKYDVTLKVVVPEVVDEVYVAGNRPELGDWDAGSVKLNRIADEEYQIQVNVQAPLEFKFTRGGWSNEGFVKGTFRGPNLQLGFEQDTTVTYEIEAWADKIQ